MHAPIPVLESVAGMIGIEPALIQSISGLMLMHCNEPTGSYVTAAAAAPVSTC